MTRGVVLLGAIAAVSFAGVGAHHSITEVYDVGRTMTVEGRVDRVFLNDPHTFVHLLVVDGRGQAHTWAVELEGEAKLRQQGVSLETFRSGDHLTVCGNPGRDSSKYRLRMLRLMRPADGLSVQISPTADSLPETGDDCSNQTG